MSDPIVIVSAARTPIGAMSGSFSSMAAHELGSAAIKAALERAGIQPEAVDEVLMGNVLQAGQGQAPARQAALGAGLPKNVPCTTVHKVCGSGMKTAMMGFDMLKAGSANVVVAGGQESMTNAPYLLLKGRSGYRYGNDRICDHMGLDGLEDACEHAPMGVFAEPRVDQSGCTREGRAAYPTGSLRRPREAADTGAAECESTPVNGRSRRAHTVVEIDESPTRANPERIPSLRPAFNKDGTVTAANASSISDGAAALVLMRDSTAKDLGAKPIATIVAHTQHAHEP